jgi:hypothetical protein
MSQRDDLRALADAARALTHREAMETIFERFFNRSPDHGYSFAEFKADALTILDAASPSPARDGDNSGAGSGLGSTTGADGFGLAPAPDVSDGLEPRDAPSASADVTEIVTLASPATDAGLDVDRLARAMWMARSGSPDATEEEAGGFLPKARSIADAYTIAAAYARLATPDKGQPYSVEPTTTAYVKETPGTDR